MERVRRGKPRRCPHCQSNRWTFIEAVPITPEDLEIYLLVKYQCEKCGEIFLSEDWRRSKLSKTRGRCAACNSRRVEKISKADADIELWVCLQCGSYTGVSR